MSLPCLHSYYILLTVNEEWESVTERLKAGLKQQEDVFAQMDLDLATKRDELSNIGEENEKLIRNISDKNEKIEKSKQEKEHMEDQKERLKIKVFELETEVEKLQQEVKKEALKKDTATQALKDGLAIVKSKKKEYEEKTKALTKEKATMKGTYEKQVTALQDEITRLKSVDSESCTDEKIVSICELRSYQSSCKNVGKKRSTCWCHNVFFLQLLCCTNLLLHLCFILFVLIVCIFLILRIRLRKRREAGAKKLMANN